jgi:hypothetical protein
MRNVGFRWRAVIVLTAVVTGVFGIVAWSGVISRPAAFQWRFAVSDGDYAARASRSAHLLEQAFYNGTGLWHMCVHASCFTKNRDWGSDSLTYVLYLRWLITGDRSVPPLLRTLAGTAPDWTPDEQGSSDTVMWDAVADAREYQVTGSGVALAKAETAFSWLDSANAASFATGACPGIYYQWPQGADGDLKTLETTSNYIKAALLLHQITGLAGYLDRAERAYATVRQYFLASDVPLYTVYVFDNGTSCRALPGRYFASVNGNMIWAGQALAKATGDQRYLSEAIATAQAVRTRLSDSTGVFADLQADNDVVEPLVEAMYGLATGDHQAFARKWLLVNAAAAGGDADSDGETGRFFDGPPPTTLVTAWQVNGGAALAQAAAALDPDGHPADPGFWQRARFVGQDRRLHGPRMRIVFTGRAIAILGTIGEGCCSDGHAMVYVDGRRTFDRTGIWQNMTSPSIRQPYQVLFAWRWRHAGRHVITIRPADYDGAEGGTFFAMTGYLKVR